jgi:hypothetical protein
VEAILLGALTTLLGVVVASALEQRRASRERILQARLREIEDTQRYVMAMMEWVSAVGIVGKTHAGPLPPNLGDYPKVTLSLLGSSEVVMAFGRYLASEMPRAWADGPRWTNDDRRRHMAIGIRVANALREQEQRVLAGKPPIIAPADEQDRNMRELISETPIPPETPP